MGSRTGLDAQVMIAAENTYGTFATPTRALSFTSESLARNDQRIESEAIIAGTRVLPKNRRRPNPKGAAGDLTIEVGTTGFGMIAEHMLGSISTETPDGATDTRAHTATLGDLIGKSLTVQVGRPETGSDTVRPFSYLGCKVGSWELSCEVDGILTCRLSLDSREEVTDKTLASFLIPEEELYICTGGEVTLDGGAVSVRRFTLTAENSIAAERYFLGDPRKKEQLRAGRPVISGELECEFESMTAYNAFVSGETVPLVIAFTGEEEIEASFLPSLTVTLPEVQLDGATPAVASTEVIATTIPFTVLDNLSDSPIEIEYVTSDTTP